MDSNCLFEKAIPFHMEFFQWADCQCCEPTIIYSSSAVVVAYKQHGSLIQHDELLLTRFRVDFV